MGKYCIFEKYNEKLKKNFIVTKIEFYGLNEVVYIKKNYENTNITQGAQPPEVMIVKKIKFEIFRVCGMLKPRYLI